MTTTVPAPSTSLSRVITQKMKAAIPGSPDVTPVTTLTLPPVDKTLIFPFSVTYLSAQGDTYTLYTETAQARQSWVEKIIEAKSERAVIASEIEPFQANVVGESVFGNPVTLELLNVKPPALVPLSTMARALTRMRAEPFGAITLGRAITHARINCAKSFIAPEGTDFAHQRLLAVGTDDGVYIGYLPEMSGLCTAWAKVLSTRETTQIDVMEEYGVFLVLANKELMAYYLNSVIPEHPARPGHHSVTVQRQPQKLSGNASVGFFATGKLKERMLVLYKKRSGINAVFKAMEPVVGNADSIRRTLFSSRRGRSEFFHDFDVPDPPSRH
jgi:CNH domain